MPQNHFFKMQIPLPSPSRPTGPSGAEAGQVYSSVILMHLLPLLFQSLTADVWILCRARQLSLLMLWVRSGARDSDFLTSSGAAHAGAEKALGGVAAECWLVCSLRFTALVSVYRKMANYVLIWNLFHWFLLHSFYRMFIWKINTELLSRFFGKYLTRTLFNSKL